MLLLSNNSHASSSILSHRASAAIHYQKHFIHQHFTVFVSQDCGFWECLGSQKKPLLGEAKNYF